MSHLCVKCDQEFPTAEALAQHNSYKHPHSMSATKKKNYWVWIIAGLVIIGFIWWSLGSLFTPSKYDGFAQCITNSGAKFYGAFWCPHCAEQKDLFGTSVKYLPYIECSTPDGNSQLPICTSAGITGYPTWVFPDNSRGSVMSLQELSQKTNCPLP